MENNSDTTVEHEFPPFIRIYKSGRVERLIVTSTVPAGTDPVTGVTSRDVLINPITGVSARLYIPPDLPSDAKLPILVYFHGGGFVIESATSPTYHNYLNLLVSKARILVVSVEYRLAPEHPLPTAYDDCWEVLASTVSGSFPDEWVSGYGDLGRLYLGGDSAGGNTTHHMAVKAASEGIKIKGLVICHPWFGWSEAIGSESQDLVKKENNLKFLRLVYPEATGLEDPIMNPMAAKERMEGVYKCEKVLVAVAQKDELRDKGKLYYDKLLEAVSSGEWNGHVEFYETEGEDHVFYLLHNRGSDKAMEMMQKVVSFID
ncbi:tuliposide A-converting enzyme 2 [Carex littledalei]|uniref:Tuliposide A-converting enzyme 2 n=1 Tax=Carex littledalei TaxID=544730 RepID=A0A833RJQ5_9POAL|nr:tuliposide A-converting enzyme 2 [Carex littledalei]